MIFKVQKLSDHPFGYRFNCQIWEELDESFFYSGFGRFCRTVEELSDYIKEIHKEQNA